MPTIYEDLITFCAEDKGGKYYKKITTGNRDKFLFHFGFFDPVVWNRLEDTGRYFYPSDQFGEANKRSHAELAVRTIKNRLLSAPSLPPTLIQLNEIFEAQEFVSSTTLKQKLLKWGLIEDISKCNLIGLFNMLQYLNMCQQQDFYTDFNLQVVRRGNYNPINEMFLISDSVADEIREAYYEARGLSVDYGLVGFPYLLETLKDKAKYSTYLMELIRAQKESYCFPFGESGDLYYHLKSNERDGFYQTLSRIFYVSDRLPIGQLAGAIIRHFVHKSGVQARDNLPVDVVCQFIRNYEYFRVDGEDVEFTGTKIRPSELEEFIINILRGKRAGVKSTVLVKFLSSKGLCTEDYAHILLSYSPFIYIDKSEGKRNYRCWLIGQESNLSEVPILTIDGLAFDELVQIQSELEEKHNLTIEEYQRLLVLAKESGDAGEYMVNLYFAECIENGEFCYYEWESRDVPLAPYDFSYDDFEGNTFYVDVKTTVGKFENEIHISYRELCKMVESDYYYIYRVYQLSIESVCLRVSCNMRDFAIEMLRALRGLPYAAKSNGISLNPTNLYFSEEIRLDTGYLESRVQELNSLDE